MEFLDIRTAHTHRPTHLSHASKDAPTHHGPLHVAGHMSCVAGIPPEGPPQRSELVGTQRSSMLTTQTCHGNGTLRASHCAGTCDWGHARQMQALRAGSAGLRPDPPLAGLIITLPHLPLCLLDSLLAVVNLRKEVRAATGLKTWLPKS